MAHVRRAVRFEQLQRLRVGEMPFPATDTVLQEVRVAALFQHDLVVISFEEGRVALLEMMNELIAGQADVRKHADPRVRMVAGDDEAVRVRGVMMFRKSRDLQLPDLDGLKCPERQRLLQLHAAVAQSSICNVHRQAIFPGEHGDAADMIDVLMRYEYCFYFLHRQPQAMHAALGFPAGNTCVNKNSFFLIADVITVSVTARVERCNE